MRQIFGALAALALVCVPLKAADAAGQSVQSVAEEYSAAEEAFRSGRADLGIQALERAANQGALRAMLSLGNIYNEGKLVAKDEAKACQLYSVAADKFSRLDKFYPAAHLVAEAFRRAGMCYVKGPAGWEKNPAFAAELFHQAGVILEDPAALFELAKLYLTGENQYHNAALAARYLEAAARKRYAPAQALLGSLMWDGKMIKRRPASGLALLILGMESTTPEDRAWITSLHDDALLTASDDLEKQAMVLVEQWKSVYDNPQPDLVQTAGPTVPTPTRAPGKEGVGISANAPLGGGPEQFGGQPTGASSPPSDLPPPQGR
jgi:hypothetical protein